MNALTSHASARFRPDPAAVTKAIAKRQFAVLATTSKDGRPHSAGVLYALVDDCLYVSTLRGSRKARNIAQTPHVGVCIPIRRLPIGPPSSVQFQATAEILGDGDPHVTTLVHAGRLTAVTGHGELALADGCLLRIRVPRRLLTYGLGMPLRQLIRDPLHASGATEFIGVELTSARQSVSSARSPGVQRGPAAPVRHGNCAGSARHEVGASHRRT